MNKRKKIVFALITILMGPLLLEGMARVLESQVLPEPGKLSKRTGWQAEFFGSYVDWHEPDPELLWRFRPNLQNPLMHTNSRRLLGPEVSVKKPAGVFRILLVGDSSPVGLGVASRDEVFGEVTQRLLSQRHPDGRKVELVNAAVSGYTSEQVRRFLELEGWDYDPDLVLVYCGNNDASISGAHPDTELLAVQKFKTLRKIASHSALFRVLLGFRGRTTAGESEELVVRVSPERYRENLTWIADRCLERGVPMILLKPPVPYLWPAGLQFKPFIHMSGKDGLSLLPERMTAVLGRDISYCWDKDRFHEVYGEGDLFTQMVFESAHEEAMAPEAVVRKYTQRIAEKPDDPLDYNNLGVTLWRLRRHAEADSVLKKGMEVFTDLYGEHSIPEIEASGSPILYNTGINRMAMEPKPEIGWYRTDGEAFRYLDGAVQADYFSLRIKRPYWDVIDSMKNAEGLTVIDLPSLFRARGNEQLFIDHCHPTPEGHELIAGEIVRTVEAKGWLAR